MFGYFSSNASLILVNAVSSSDWLSPSPQTVRVTGSPSLPPFPPSDPPELSSPSEQPASRPNSMNMKITMKPNLFIVTSSPFKSNSRANNDQMTALSFPY